MTLSESYSSTESMYSKSSSISSIEEDKMQSIPNDGFLYSGYYSSEEESYYSSLTGSITKYSTPRPLRVPSRKSLSVIIPQSAQKASKLSFSNNDSDNSNPSNKMVKSFQNIQPQQSSGHSYNTESIYTHSSPGKLETPKIPGPPPLKRTFLEDLSTDTSEINEEIQPELYKDSLIIKPDWNFPIEPHLFIDDEPRYEFLRQKYTVKNIVSQVKHSV